MKSPKTLLAIFAVLLATSAMLFAGDGGWLRKVPAADRARTNPFSGNLEAISAGKALFAENCAQCHGTDARGHHGRPNLRSDRVAHATDGELAWLLRNGSLWKGMPSWSALPQPERWQIIAYLRSLEPDSKPSPASEAHDSQAAK